MAARVLKIGMHLQFDPKFTVEFEYFDQKYFRQAYCTMKCSIYPLMPTNVITYTDGWWSYVRNALVIIHVFLHHYNFGKERPISHGLYFVSDNSDLLAVRVVTSSNSVISIGHSSNSGSKSSRYAQHSNAIPIFFTLAGFTLAVLTPITKLLQ